jgi:hypothetical protein
MNMKRLDDRCGNKEANAVPADTDKADKKAENVLLLWKIGTPGTRVQNK